MTRHPANPAGIFDCFESAKEITLIDEKPSADGEHITVHLNKVAEGHPTFNRVSKTPPAQRQWMHDAYIARMRHDVALMEQQTSGPVRPPQPTPTKKRR